MHRISSALLILLLTAASSAHSVSSRLLTTMPDFVLEDQYERSWSSKNFRGGITVFVLSDRSGYEYTTNWTNGLVPRFKSAPVRFVPVADLQTVPGFLKGLIRSKFREEFSYPVLMDWDGVLIDGFNMEEGYTNLIIVDKQGTVRHAVYGTGSPGQVEAFAKRLEQIIAAS